MSKHTERGIGQQGDPIGDSDDAKPRKASEIKISPQPDAADEELGSKRADRPDIGQITLLGVPAPVVDREKVTAPGRDVHLPVEVRRVPLQRSVAPDPPAAVPAVVRRPTPEPARVALEATPTIRIKNAEQALVTSSPARAAGDERHPANPVKGGRRDDRTMLMDVSAPVGERGVGGLIALGVGGAVALAVLVVWAVRFGPSASSGGTAMAPDLEARSDPTLVPRLPAAQAPPEPPAPSAEAPPPADEVPPPLPSAEAPTALAPAAALAPPNGAGDLSDEEKAEKDRIARRLAARPRPAAAPLTAVPTGGAAVRRPPALPPRSGGAFGSTGTPPSAVTPAPFTTTPPPGGAAPPRQPAGRIDEKPPYDPDSPLPPASE